MIALIMLPSDGSDLIWDSMMHNGVWIHSDTFKILPDLSWPMGRELENPKSFGI